MARGGKGRYKRKSRNMVRGKDKSSDDSDEDYMVAEDEEVRESEDEYCLGSDGDESEEILGELEVEEEEEFVEEKVKKVGRSNVNKGARSRGRKKNGTVKPKTKRRASSREDGDEDDDDDDDEEDDDDEDDVDYDFHDEKINKVAKQREKRKVSYREEDDEYDVTHGNFDDVKVNKVGKRGKRKKVSYREQDDEYDATDDNLDDIKVDKVVKSRKKRRRVSYIEEDDDYDGMDADFDDVKVNEVVKSRNKKRVSYMEDDDYDGTDEDFDDVKVNKIVKSREKKRVRNREDDNYDGMEDDFDDVKVNQVVKSREKKRVSYKEEDEDEDVEAKNDDFDCEKLNKVAKPRKEKEVSHREEDDEYDGVDDDVDDDDDEDDDEFTPDEIDGVDDEDELPAVTKKKRVGRRRLQGKGISKGRKRTRNSFKGLKKNEKKPKSNLRRRRKGITGKDREFLDAKPILEEKNKKVIGRRRKKYIHSDSDFVSSGSSDYEFTISEEEREQIREANSFCRRFTTNLRTSSNKLEDVKPKPAQRKLPARKGKEKVEDLNVEAAKQVCGICLTEEGKRTVRGTLSCCSHYFCFTCIMEWSKVESRCPLCKQRFVTISKPARSNAGFDLRTVEIQIPERDQVYQPSEEELQGFLNPYDDVMCIECHQGGDDALMLLCDLCDSPAHTYCVGLGHEVPEGNWYCEGCRPTALDSSNPQVLTPPPEDRTNSNLSVGLSPVSSIRETFDLNEMYVPETPLTQETSQLPSPRPSVGDVQLPSPASGSGAFTVQDRRRIHRQIHQFINNRRRQMDDRNSETQAAVLGHSLFGSQVGQSRESAIQHSITPESIPSNEIYFHESLQENTVPLLQNPRLAHMRGQACENQPSTSNNGSLGEFSHNEFSGINSRNGLGLDHQQLQPCSSRLKIGCDGSTSSFNVEKEQVASMVKHHLKSLSRDLNLVYDTFKDIARSSTHTILAACGIDHRPNEVSPVQTPLTCTHVEKGHCPLCFDSFVRNVVREIMNTRVATMSKN